MEMAPVGVQMTYANASNAAQVQHNLNHASALQQDFQAVREKNDAELKQQALPFIKFHEKRTASPAFCCNLLYFIVSYFLPLCNS